ncbi:uncharacterized protein LOC135333062 [Halichondria panicea]|uniref:uncharacterized protein LOC135333062 n=1 Tax=Halichondria panicea TaxID=6063 RepID=UPI00312BC9AE
MATSAQEAGSGLDQILKNTEFENDHQLKAIKAEQERAQSCQFQLKEKQKQILQFQKTISDLDEHAKQLHKQFLINRDNCESLKCTAIVLADHEDALKGKLLTTQKEVESEKWEQNESLSKYESVWERYRVQYNSTEKAQGIQATETQLNNLRQENSTLETNINQTKEAIFALKQKGERTSLVAFVLKMAELHVETTKVRQKMTTGNPQQATLLEKDIEVLREKIKAEEMKKQQEKEKRDSQNKVVQDNRMDTEESTSVTMVTQSTHTPQRPRTPGILPPTILPLTVPPKQSTPSRARYQLEIPKLTMPSRVPAIRASISQSPRAFQSPVFKVPTNRPRSNFQIPTLAISTPPRPSIPLLHTPVQQRPRLLSFTPPTARSTPQVTLSTPNIRPTVSTLATSQSSSAVQTPTTTVPQAGHNQAPMQPSSLSKATNNVGIEIQDSVAEMDNQTLQQESGGFELCSTSQESTSFATLFTSDSGQECTDYAGDFGQTGHYQESSVNDQQQLEFTGEDDNGLFYGMEGSLSGLGNQPDTSATGDMFARLGSESAHDDGGGFNLFSQDEAPNVSKTTTGATDTDFCFLFEGDETASGESSFSFF